MPLLVVREVEKVKMSGILLLLWVPDFPRAQKGEENAMSWQPIVISLNQLLCPTVFDLVSIILSVDLFSATF